MSLFKYRVLTTGSSVIEGKKDALTQMDLISDLRKSGYVVLKVQKVGEERRISLPFGRAKRGEILHFTQELATLLESGIPMDRSLTMMVDAQENGVLKAALEDILGGIKGGKSLANALSGFPKLFSNVYVNMVRAGEEGGVLPQVLKRLGSFEERIQKVKGEIISAMIYPLLLTFTGILSIAALIVYVIPKFSQIFQGIGIPMPLSTLILMRLNHIVVMYGWIFLIIFGVLFFLYRRSLRNEGTHLKIDRKKLSLPILGNILWKIQVSRFARTLGTLLENGVPLLKSIDIVKDVLSNAHLVDILEKAKANVKEGEGLTRSLARRGFLPEIAVHLLSVGEETGNLDKMLIKVADSFDADTEQKIKRLVTLVEPVLILFMGGVIGSIIISMLTAIFSINEVSF
ncbi:MAG TPA: type II secretion system F family protein [Candidatus Brocadiia bacterium]|nr:type II secretion system F family protein [Planctomycetota bacterium]MBI4007007.1 type II secretion system F family protein [Planctomycetota bacterium]MDO8093165.1 type II secretion system F family protein [Candidatus Brocadiales bacterium]